MALAPALSSEDGHSKLQLVRRSDDDVWPCLTAIATVATCHNRDRTYPYSPYPNLSTPIPSHLNHS